MDQEKYAVRVQDGRATTATAIDVTRDEALRVARELRAEGRHAYIMRLDADCATCAVHADDPAPAA